MHSSLFLCIALLLIRGTAARDGRGERQALKAEIEATKKEIEKVKNSGNANIGHLWGQLGMLYQAHDVKFHDGGTLQPLALDAFQKAIQHIDSDTVLYQIYQRMGMLLKMMGRGADAVAAHATAFNLADTPDSKADALLQHSNALGMMGDLRGSIELLEKALSLYPKGLAVYLPLVSTQKELKEWDKTQWSALVDAMTNALKNASPDGIAKKLNLKISPDIYWAMFQALEVLERYHEAWEYLEIAHSATLASRPSVSSVEAMNEQLRQVVSVFQKGMFPEPSLGYTSRVPIFIIGMMRSGSTLLETMLDSHPEIYGMGEDSFFNSGLNQLRDDLVEVISLNDNIATQRVLQTYGKSVVDKMVNQALNDSNNVDKSVGNARPRRVVDKMLFNYRNIGFIHLIFPRAVIIHTVRDPMDTILSCFRHKFDDTGLDWALDKERLSRQYINYLKNMHHFRKVLPDRVYDVNYEALVTSTEKTMRDVFKKIDVRWDNDVLNFYEKNRTVHTHSMGQVRHKVTSSGIGGWRKYAKELKPLIDLLKPELRRLKMMGSLPFRDELNWDLDPDFNYSTPWSNNSNSPVKQNKEVPPVNPRRRRGTKIIGAEVQVDGSEYSSCGVEDVKKARKRKRRKDQITTKKQKKVRKAVEKDDIAEKKRHRQPQRKRKVAHRRDSMGDQKLLTVISKWKDKARSPMSGSLRNQLPFRSKRKDVADILVLVYGFYLDRHLTEAVLVLTDALNADASLREDPGVNLAMTQAYLAMHQPDECLPFSRKLVELEPNFTDGYLAYASALGSLDRHEEAIEILTRGLVVSPNEPNLLLQRGFNYFKVKKYKSAHSDFKAVKMDQGNAAYILSLIGKCEKEFGYSEASIKTLTKSLKIDKNQADAHLDMAIVLMEVGRVKEALEFVNRSLEIDPTMRNTWGYAGLLYQTLGECKKATYYLGKTLEIDPHDHTSLLLSAMCYQAELDFSSSFKFFDRLLNLRGENSYEPNVPFHREIAFYRMNFLDTPLLEYNFDVVVDKKIKAGLNKGGNFDFPMSVDKSVEINARKKASEEEARPPVAAKRAQEVLDLTAQLRGWIQLNSPGFLPHRRQHRMFGLSVLEMAQQIRQHVKAVQSGEPGLWVSDARSSIQRVVGGMVRPTDVRRKGYHLFSYRDFFDTAVKWRQFADPFDIVFWLDGYPPKSQMDMVALSTSLYSGLKRNTRYYPYFNMTFEVVRREIKEKYFAGPEPTYTSKSLLPAISNARTIGDLFEITNVPSIMFVVTECESLVNPARKIPGTRVVLSRVPPEGFDISIGSPTEEDRSVLFSAEVEASFNRIIDALVQGKDTDTIVDLTLNLYFYWANWGPLSRGTAATGYAAIISLLLSVGEHVTSKIPYLKQMDWEAILRTSPSEFRDAVRPWLSGREKTTISAEWLDGITGHSLLNDIFLTYRDAVSALSAPDASDEHY